MVVTPDGFRQPSPHRALETGEIRSLIEGYRTAAENAKEAGFDGVELMAAHGHLIDQFLRDRIEAQGPVGAQELIKVFRGPVIAARGFEPSTAKSPSQPATPAWWHLADISSRT
jgi:hypothetical protein